MARDIAKRETRERAFENCILLNVLGDCDGLLEEKPGYGWFAVLS